MSYWGQNELKKTLFNEWKELTLTYLSLTSIGKSALEIKDFFNSTFGEEIPIQEMEFQTVGQFLYEFYKDLEIRKRLIDGKIFIFFKGPIDENIMHIKELADSDERRELEDTNISNSYRPEKPTRDNTIGTMASSLLNGVVVTSSNSNPFNKPSEDYNNYSPSTIVSNSSNYDRKSRRISPTLAAQVQKLQTSLGDKTENPESESKVSENEKFNKFDFDNSEGMNGGKSFIRVSDRFGRNLIV